jgi:hypothetical protein
MVGHANHDTGRTYPRVDPQTPHPFSGEAMHKQIGRIGSVRRELHGKACPFCGGHKYQLLLRSYTSPGTEGLLARCSQCQRAKELDEELGRILWM